MLIVLIWCLAASAAAFALFGADKYRARRGLRRVPERTLLLAALLGGSPGAILGMRLFRHKTRHRQFRYGLPIICALQLLLAAYLFDKGGLP